MRLHLKVSYDNLSRRSSSTLSVTTLQHYYTQEEQDFPHETIMTKTQPIILIGICWLLSSAFFSTWANTTFLNHFKSPLLHIFIRFSGSSMFGLLYLLLSGEAVSSDIPEMLHKVFLPSMFLWVANFSNSLSLQWSGITLTYVVKACIPVFTVALCSLRGQVYPWMTYASLCPTVLGVALASFSDLDFSVAGLLAALTSALAQTLMNVTVKEVRTKTGYSGVKMLAAMTTVCSALSCPVFFFTRSASQSGNKLSLGSGIWWSIFLIAANALAFHMEYVLNMIFVGFVNPVSFSVSDVGRRLGIILCGCVVFGKTLTATNSFGVALALGGVLWYSYVENASRTDMKKLKE